MTEPCEPRRESPRVACPTTLRRAVTFIDDNATHAISAADPAATTVAAIAAHFGFASPSRFAASYRQTYGVLPGGTLQGR